MQSLPQRAICYQARRLLQCRMDYGESGTHADLHRDFIMTSVKRWTDSRYVWTMHRAARVWMTLWHNLAQAALLRGLLGDVEGALILGFALQDLLEC